MSAPVEVPSPAGPGPARALSRHAWRLAALTAVVLFVFWRSLYGEFVYDDLWLVVRNPNIQSTEMLSKALTGAYWDFIDPEEAARIGYWRPLTFLTLWVGHQLGGGDPLAFHAISIAVHLAATFAAYFLALRLTGSANIAFWTALLFGVHPVQVEAVAWISSVNDPLYGLFCLVGLAAFLRWRENGSRGWCAAAPLWMGCALLAKENALAMLPLVLALDFGRRRTASDAAGLLRPFWRAWLPFATVLLAYWGARVWVFGDWRGGFDRVTSYLALDTGREITMRLELFGGFLGLLAFPLKLNLFRDLRPVIPLSDALFWGSLVWIVVWGVAGLALWKRSSRPALAAFGMAIAGVLPALIRLESIGRFPLSERFLYVSVFGAVLLIVMSVGTWLPKRGAHAVLVVLALAASVHSFRRIPTWRTEERLFAQAAIDNPNSPYVLWSYGRVLLERFRMEGSPETLDGAYAAFSRSQDLGGRGPDGKRDLSIFFTADDRLQANLGVGWYFFFGAVTGLNECTFGEAELVFRETLKGFPDSESASTGLGVSLMYEAERLQELLQTAPPSADTTKLTTAIESKLTEAETSLRRGVQLNPKAVESWFYLGRFQVRMGLPCEAAESFEAALVHGPDDRTVSELLGGALADCGRLSEAQRVLQQALESHPNDPGLLLRMGVVAAQMEQYSASLRWFDRVLDEQPQNGEAHLQRAKVLLRTDALDRAIPALDRACQIMPSSFEAHYNLGSLLAQLGNYEDALPRLERALAIEPQGPYAGALQTEIERIQALANDGG